MTDSLDVLRAIAAIPTAPLHEAAVARHIAAHLKAAGLSIQPDPYGNLLARIHRGEHARPLALVAHMDHPGLEVTAADGKALHADVLGGLRPSTLAPGVPLRLHRDDGAAGGSVQRYRPADGARRASVEILAEEEFPSGAFGTLDLPSFVRDGDLLRLRAADDLAQCACLVLLAERLAVDDSPMDVTLVFTRAEEIGLVGATLVAQAGLLAPDTIVVSLECSKELPGAEIGGGPVIRVGDAGQAFHPNGEALLLAARDRLIQAARRDGMAAPAIQRQLMSGGRCEAGAFQAFGYVTAGMVFPLGNYHNLGPDGQAAPEYIHTHDFLGGIELLGAVVAEAASPPLDRRTRLEEGAVHYERQLADSALAWRLGANAAPVSRSQQ